MRRPEARHGRLALVALAAALATPGAAAGQEAGSRLECTVAHVIDGDTLNCANGDRVRLDLIDAPESGPFGTAARNAMVGLLPVGATVRLELDERVRDPQGRLLAYVFLEDGRMVNEMLIRQGYAFYKPNMVDRRYAARLRAAETAARTAGLGIWTR